MTLAVTRWGVSSQLASLVHSINDANRPLFNINRCYYPAKNVHVYVSEQQQLKPQIVAFAFSGQSRSMWVELKLDVARLVYLCLHSWSSSLTGYQRAGGAPPTRRNVYNEVGKTVIVLLFFVCFNSKAAALRWVCVCVLVGVNSAVRTSGNNFPRSQPTGNHVNLLPVPKRLSLSQLDC